MSREIDAFLAAYKPKYICLVCLAEVTARDPADVKQAVDSLIAERRAETQVAECLNCNATALSCGDVDQERLESRAWPRAA